MKHATLVAALALAACQTAPSAQLAERNKAFVIGCMKLMTEKKMQAYAECWAEDVNNNTNVTSREGVARVAADIVTTFPDWEWRVLSAVAEGDTVVVEALQIGTHLGVATTGFNGGGLRGVPPTGKRMEIRAMHKWTLKDGKVVLHQAVRDDLTMMRQLGLAPPAPEAPASPAR